MALWGIQDVKPQMHCVLVRKGETREEYHGKVVRQSGSELWLQMDREALGSIREKTPYDIQIVVDNVLYNWTDVLANVENEQGRDVCHLVVKNNTCHCKTEENIRECRSQIPVRSREKIRIKHIAEKMVNVQCEMALHLQQHHDGF